MFFMWGFCGYRLWAIDALYISLAVHAPQKNSCESLFWIRNSLWVHDMHCNSYEKSKSPFFRTNVIHNETFNIYSKTPPKNLTLYTRIRWCELRIFACLPYVRVTILCTRNQEKCSKKWANKKMGSEIKVICHKTVIP